MAQRMWRKKALLLKTEASYGVDAAPTGAANAILAVNVALRPLEAEAVSRNLDRPWLGAQGEVLAGIHAALEFDVEMAGAGVAGEAPKYGPALAACGLAETIEAGVDVRYAPVSSGFGSCSVALNIDGVVHRMLGCRGTVAIAVSPRQIPYLRFRLMGLAPAPADAALPAADYSGFATPLVVSDATTPAFQIAGSDRVLESFEVELGNDVQTRLLVNQEAVVIADRRVSGQAVVEAGLLAEFDPFAWARSRTRVAVLLTHGTAAGQIVEVGLPTVEIGAPAYGNSQGIANYTLPLLAVPTAGDDEILITVK